MSAGSDVQVLRSALYMPSSNVRALEKAKTIPADAIIFDLEDAVAPDAKQAAREAGIAVLDGVFNDVKDLAGYEAECVQGFELGFDGKTLVHPTQVEIANRVWAPSADEVDYAHRVLAAFDQALADGKGVVTVDGRMIENLHVDNARRTLAIAQAVAALC